ncbi:hypothetical protein AGMMS49938_05800 [Fibrobacterales bacterium]|nr:hypothetical protein AGMMS49938_05800 [Fibrobacterales bacterium]
MQIDFVPHGNEQNFSLTESFAPDFFKELHLKDKLNGSFVVTKEKGGFAIRGTVSGVQEFEDARTLENFDRPFEIEVEVIVLREQGLSTQVEDDGSEDFFTLKIPPSQKFADLTETIRQLIILQEPMIALKE